MHPDVQIVGLGVTRALMLLLRVGIVFEADALPRGCNTSPRDRGA